MTKQERSRFFAARVIVYLLSAFLLLIMLIADPFADRYICNQPGIECPGCGFKTGLWLLLNGRIQQAISTNALVLPAIAFSLIAVIDLATNVLITIRKTN